MNLYDLEHRHAERNAFLRASNARRADANGPHVRNFVEMPRRASGVSVGSFAAHLIQTPAFAVTLITELLHETAGIEVRPARALLMNVAVVCELRPPLCHRAQAACRSRQIAGPPRAACRDSADSRED